MREWQNLVTDQVFKMLSSKLKASSKTKEETRILVRCVGVYALSLLAFLVFLVFRDDGTPAVRTAYAGTWEPVSASDSDPLSRTERRAVVSDRGSEVFDPPSDPFALNDKAVTADGGLPAAKHMLPSAASSDARPVIAVAESSTIAVAESSTIVVAESSTGATPPADSEAEVGPEIQQVQHELVLAAPFQVDRDEGDPPQPLIDGPAAELSPRARLRNRVNSLVERVVEPELKLTVKKRRSKILRLKLDVFRVSIADPSLIDFVAFDSNEMEIIGKEIGTTTLNFWLGDADNAEVLSVLVTVTKDDAIEDQRRMEFGELELMIAEMFPSSKVQLIPIADKVIVRGTASDEQEATQIMQIIRRNQTNQNNDNYGNGVGNFSNLQVQGVAAEPFPGASNLPMSTVISMLKVPGEKQVLLKVRIAELERTAVRRLGIDFDFDVDDFMFASATGAAGNLLSTGTFDGDTFNLMLEAMEGNGTGKILAEPNLVVLSGETGNFLAGGEFAVPTVVGVGGAQAATTTFKGFGTQLNVTPTVVDKDRVRLHVAPSFSTVNPSLSVGGVFGTDTRSVATTVDLREGQVLAIAGLVQEQQRGDSVRVPWLGNVPLVKQFFQHKSVSREETELVILVSPELVHPMEPEQAPLLLPGMEVTEPNDFEFYHRGNIEGDPDCHHRSTVWPLVRDRIQRGDAFRHKLNRSAGFFLSGQHGFAD